MEDLVLIENTDLQEIDGGESLGYYIGFTAGAIDAFFLGLGDGFLNLR